MELARQLRELKRSKDVLEALGMRWIQPRRCSLERALSCKPAGKIQEGGNDWLCQMLLISQVIGRTKLSITFNNVEDIGDLEV